MSCPRHEIYDQAVVGKDTAMLKTSDVHESFDSMKRKAPIVLRQGYATMRGAAAAYLPVPVQKAIVTPKSVSLPYASAFQSATPVLLQLLGVIFIVTVFLVFLLALAAGTCLVAYCLGVLEVRRWSGFEKSIRSSLMQASSSGMKASEDDELPSRRIRDEYNVFDHCACWIAHATQAPSMR